MGLSPYDKKRYKESKRRRRQAILQSETGYIVPYRRSKKPVVIGICVLALVLIAAAIIAVVSACNSKPVSSASVSSEIESGERMRVVNRANRLDEDYKPSLISFYGVEVHKGITDSLEQLIKAAATKGVSLKAAKGYVSFDDQQKLYDQNLEAFMKKPDYTPVRAQAAAQMIVPEAGCSEAQTGLLVEFDLSDPHAKSFLERECINYGFILRYPEGKEEITHRQAFDNVYRYVGKEDAGKMRSFDMCLEEYSDYLGSRE